MITRTKFQETDAQLLVIRSNTDLLAQEILRPVNLIVGIARLLQMRNVMIQTQILGTDAQVNVKLKKAMSVLEPSPYVSLFVKTA